MDKNNDALAAAYGLVLESKDGTVGKDMSGKSFEGSEKASPKDNPFKNAEETQKKKPVGPSQGEATVADGKGKPAAKSKDIPKKSVKENSGIPTTFDQLYNSILNEENAMGDENIAPAGDVEGSEFDPDAGDFNEGEPDAELGEPEVFDAATAFRALADSIAKIADQLGGMGATEEAGDELGGEEGAEGAEGGEDFAGEGTEKPFGESVTIGKIPAPTTPKVAKKTTFSPTMTKNPKNNVGKSGAGKAGLPAAGKDRTGTLSKAPTTKFGPKMSQTVGGTGPIAKGGNDSFIK
jgi:hypothetical protein